MYTDENHRRFTGLNRVNSTASRITSYNEKPPRPYSEYNNNNNHDTKASQYLMRYINGDRNSFWSPPDYKPVYQDRRTIDGTIPRGLPPRPCARRATPPRQISPPRRQSPAQRPEERDWLVTQVCNTPWLLHAPLLSDFDNRISFFGLHKQ